MEGESRVLAAIALLALITVGGLGLLYVKVSDLERRYGELSSALEEQAARQERSLGELGSSVESLSKRIDELSGSIEELAYGQEASRERVEDLARQLAELRAQLDALRAQVEAQGEAQAGVAEQLAALEERLASLEERLASVEERLLFPVTVVDGSGDEVVILERPERIVSVAPSATELLYYLNLLDRLVGVDDYSDWPPSVAEARERGEIASVGGFWTPSVEAILELQPDLVVGVATAPPHHELKRVLEGYGIPVLLLPAESIYDVAEAAVMLGRATGQLVEGYTVALKVKMAAGYALTLLKGVEPVKAAAVVWVNPLFVVGSGNWEDEVMSLAGMVNVYGDLEGWPQVSPESLLERAPEVIVMTGHDYGLTPDDLKEYLREQLGDAANEIPAIASDAVYILGGDYEDAFVRPSPRTVLAIYVLAVIAHPDAFGLSPGDVPKQVTPDTLDVLSLLEGRVPQGIVEFLRVALQP